MFNDYNAFQCQKDMCTIDNIEIDASYFGHIEEDYQKLKSKIAWNHFGLDDVIEEKKILNHVSKKDINELQDDVLDHATLKTLEAKHMKKNLKINVQEVESSFLMTSSYFKK